MSENRLKYETSPYLLQHKDNPVHWWAWGPEALAEAKRTGKPILLSVGYAACHWCHVMAHESFEDEPTAQVMNDLFVNIKVDREERPDIDAIYMGALHRLGEQGGSPLTMFLDSDARPFWGGTYFPKQSRFGRPAFVTVLLRLAEAYQSQPENVRNNAEAIVESLQAEGRTIAGAKLPDDKLIAELVRRITSAVDKVHGGLSGAPKFPQWNVFWLHWRGAIAFDDPAAKEAVVTTLTHICQGGIYDHLGGGFARYSVDERWLVPHFEKMLYDNALLIDLMTEVWRETQSPLFAERISETVAWLKREMTGEGGAFAASLDADSEGEEGKFYVWSLDEVERVLGAHDTQLFNRIYDVTAEGNFEGHNILNRLGSLAPLSAAEEARLAQMRAKLFAVRAPRVRPGWDDKVLADWNGLMIAALVRAAVIFEKTDWLDLALSAFDGVCEKLDAGNGRLFHAYRAGQAKAPATAADYANMVWAALRLYEATGEDRHLDQAKAWTTTLQTHYWDGGSGGYFTSADDTSDVIVRMKSAHDDAVPNANAIQLSNLLKLAALTGDTAYEEFAEALLLAFAGTIAGAPVGHCGLIAGSLDQGRLLQVAVTGTSAGALQDIARRTSMPGDVLSLQTAGKIKLAALPDQNAKNSALDSCGYICLGNTCLEPVREPSELKLRLLEARRAKLTSVFWSLRD